MQIIEIVLYSKAGQKRIIPLKAGHVNIITGDSGTGKSSLADIIDYCLGQSECMISAGVVRKHVSWFGLLLQFANDRMFIARENPPEGKKTVSDVYIEHGDLLQSPNSAPSASNTTRDALIETLSNKVGIAPNLHTPPLGQTRPSISANIRHTSYYYIQEQDEIASKSLLFHQQSEPFIPQTIKDTLPYFLGAIQEDQLALEQELSRARLELKRINKILKENETIQGEGLNRAKNLLIEAQEVQLISFEDVPQNTEEVISLLQNVILWNPESGEVFSGASRLTELQNELKDLQFRLDEVTTALHDARKFAQEAEGFTSEIRQQEQRLLSIQLFDTQTHEAETCPVCLQSLPHPIPKASAIHEAISQIQKNLNTTAREQPKLRSYIEDLEQQRLQYRQSIRERNGAIKNILQENDTALRLSDLNARRGRVIGRISLWLESLDRTEESSRLKDLLSAAQSKVTTLEQKLDAEDKDERLTSILSRISLQMAQWSQRLSLEYSDNPVRLDAKKLTVVVDTNEGAIPLAKIGSAQNWMGYHLITLLALHKHFILQSRPTPHFLFLDQPSQVYFPQDQDLRINDSLELIGDNDRQSLKKAFSLLFDLVEELFPKLQVIITEHADLKDDKRFQDSIVQRWRNGDALIPQEWIG